MSILRVELLAAVRNTFVSVDQKKSKPKKPHAGRTDMRDEKD